MQTVPRVEGIRTGDSAREPREVEGLLGVGRRRGRHLKGFEDRHPSPTTKFGFVVVQSLHCVLTLCDPMVCSAPDLPVLLLLLEFAQTYVR